MIPKLALWTLLPMPFIPLVARMIGKRVHQRFHVVQESFSEISASAQENFAGIRVVKAYAQEGNQTRDFDALCAGQADN